MFHNLSYLIFLCKRKVNLPFAGSENTFDYLHATKAYLQQLGKPLAFNP